MPRLPSIYPGPTIAQVSPNMQTSPSPRPKDTMRLSSSRNRSGASTTPIAGQRLPVSSIVLVNAMVPLPGETPGEWWGNTGAIEARDEAAVVGGYGPFELETYFLHDVDTTGLRDEQYPESDRVFGTPCSFSRWPDVPIRVLAGADDRFFPLALQQRVARDRLGIEPDVLPGGHLIALAQPQLVADYLLT